MGEGGGDWPSCRWGHGVDEAVQHDDMQDETSVRPCFKYFKKDHCTALWAVQHPSMTPTSFLVVWREKAHMPEVCWS